jgi:hypothetical protein
LLAAAFPAVGADELAVFYQRSPRAAELDSFLDARDILVQAFDFRGLGVEFLLVGVVDQLLQLVKCAPFTATIGRACCVCDQEFLE